MSECKKINIYDDGIGFVQYVSHMGSDVTVVNSARVSFGQHTDDLTKRDIKLISYLIKHRHTSTLEHNLITFIDPVIYDDAASKVIRVHHEASLYLYERLLEAGICREQARGVLPQNLYTEYYGTVNLNNLFKFIGLRLHEGAQWEIQQVAKACLEIAKELFPVTAKAYEKNIGIK